MKKFKVLIGSYGSGKTEFALNLALKSAGEGKKVQLIDLDRINDYFRMSDQIRLIEDSDIKLISPTFAGSGVTQTNMPAAVASAFDSEWDLVIFDVGGDPAGALSLARYRQDFDKILPEQLEVYDIVNVFRPASDSPERIMNFKAQLEDFARMEITGFINNSNLMNLASADDLRQGYRIIRETSEKYGIPVKYTSGRETALKEFLADGLDAKYIGEPVILKKYMNRDVDTFADGVSMRGPLKRGTFNTDF